MVRNKFGQMKIMQMSFMIIAVFIFFILVGLFVFGIVIRDLYSSADDLARDEAIVSLEVISAMTEFNYDSDESMAIDEDKLDVLVAGEVDMSEFWPVASIEFYKVYPAFDKVVECPGLDCNYYNIYDSLQRNTEKVSAYVSICKRVKESGSVYDRCEIGKIVVGMDKVEDEE